MFWNKIIILLMTMCIASYVHSAANAENSHMIKLVFVLKITDEAKYQAYRNKIKSLMNELEIVVLKEYRVSKVVHSDEEKEHINMLAMFGFPNLKAKDKFFSSKIYQDAKILFVESTTNFEKLIE